MPNLPNRMRLFELIFTRHLSLQPPKEIFVFFHEFFNCLRNIRPRCRQAQKILNFWLQITINCLLNHNKDRINLIFQDEKHNFPLTVPTSLPAACAWQAFLSRKKYGEQQVTIFATAESQKEKKWAAAHTSRVSPLSTLSPSAIGSYIECI